MKIGMYLSEDIDVVDAYFAIRGISEFDKIIIQGRGERPRNWIDAEVQANFLNEIGDKQVVFHTDYDTDGISSAGVARAYYPDSPIIVPERADGYGLSIEATDHLDSDSVVVTADCGITANQAVSELKRRGIKTVVTDHHIAQGVLPQCMIVHPSVLGSPFTGYSGAGVLYKTLSAIHGDNPAALQFAAIGTVADMMPMLDENRLIVRSGLASIQEEPAPQIKALLDAINKKPKFLRYTDISFYISPVINSCSRLGRAQLALDWVNAKSYDEALPIAKEMAELNNRRKTAVESVVDTVEIIHSGRVIIALAEGTTSGYTGLIANTLINEHKLPTIVLVESDGGYVASARAPRWFDLTQMINWLRGKVHIEGGGHKAAAGFRLKDSAEIGEFIWRTEDYMDTVRIPEVIDEIYVDFAMPVSMLPSAAKQLSALEPFGTGFEKPTFASIITVDETKLLGKDKNHLRVTAHGIDFMIFYYSGDITVAEGETLSVVYEIDTPHSMFTKRPAMIVRNYE